MSQPQTTIAYIAHQYHLHIIYSFGSRSLEALQYLTGELAELPPSPSDLDIGVLPSSPLSVQSKVELALDLEDLFNVPRVDLVVIPEAGAFLAANIICGERLYAADTYQADEYDLYILRRAGDLADLERWRMKMILEGA